MRVAVQEDIAVPASDAVAGRAPGASASGAFTALLALLQGAAVPAAIEPPGAGGAIVESAPEAAPPPLGPVAAAAPAAAGVVVTLSAASAFVAAGTATTNAVRVAPGAGDAPQGGGGRPAGAVALAAVAGDTGGVVVAGSVPKGDGGTSAVAQGQGPSAHESAIATARAAALDTAPPAADGVPTGDATATRRPGIPADAAAPGMASTRRSAGAGTQLAGAPDMQSVPQGDDAATSRAYAPAGTGDGKTIEEGARTAASSAARRGTAHASAATPEHAAATAPAQRGADADGDEPESGDDDALPAARGTGGAAPERDRPIGVRLLTEPAHELAGRARDGAAGGDAPARAEGLGIARGDALAGNGASAGAERARASGFTTADAGLPSWIERLSRPEGLAATRRGDALHMDLEPNGLGRIEIRLSLGRDGLRATVIAEHEHTRNLLASQQPQLAAALERNELRLESFLVDVGTHAGGDGREAWRDATDPAAFDQIGMVHVTERDDALDDPSRASDAPRGLVNVRA